MLCSPENFCKVIWQRIRLTNKIMKGTVGPRICHAFLIPSFSSKRNLEMASHFCTKYFGEKLNFEPTLNNADIRKMMNTRSFRCEYVDRWRNSKFTPFISRVFMQDGYCTTFNSIRARYIFRNDSVDPSFLDNFEGKTSPKALSKMEPKEWNIETGYTPNKMQYYPLKSLRKGLKNGLRVTIKTFAFKDNSEIDETCRKDPESIKIALHHPAEVALQNNFITVPFNQTVQLMIRPKITKSSDSLKSYDPEV
jgi:hypothetical protein